MRPHRFDTPSLVAVVAAAVLLTSCVRPDLGPEPAPIASPAVGASYTVLAGTWEYEESSQVYTLVLDDRGSGRYDFEDGHFETIGLADHTWRGLWHQRKNDREGGFEVTLSPDFSQGQGRWWYTRIETDRAPTKPGGTFMLRRIEPDSTPLRQNP